MPGSLAFVPSLAHLAALERTLPIHSVTLLTDHLTVRAALDARDIPCCSLLSYLKEEEYEEQIALAQSLAEIWHQPKLSNLEFRGVKVCQAMQYDLWLAFVGALCTKIAFSRVLDEVKPDAFILFDEFSTPVVWDGPNEDYPDPVNAVMRSLAEDRKINVRLLPRVKHEASSQLSPAAPTPSLQMLDELNNFRDRNVIAAFGSSLDYHQLGLLPKELQKSGGATFVYIRNTPFPFEQRFAVDFKYFRDAPCDYGAFDAALSEAARGALETSSGMAAKHPEIFANSAFRFEFNAFFEGLRQAARIIQGTQLVVDWLKPSLCLFGCDTPGLVRCQVEAARAAGVPTVAYSHATFHDPAGVAKHNSPADFVAVRGEVFQKALIAAGRATESIKVVGDPLLRESSKQHAVLPEKLSHFVGNRPLVLLLTAIVDFIFY